MSMRRRTLNISSIVLAIAYLGGPLCAQDNNAKNVKRIDLIVTIDESDGVEPEIMRYGGQSLKFQHRKLSFSTTDDSPATLAIRASQYATSGGANAKETRVVPLTFEVNVAALRRRAHPGSSFDIVLDYTNYWAVNCHPTTVRALHSNPTFPPLTKIVVANQMLELTNLNECPKQSVDEITRIISDAGSKIYSDNDSIIKIHN